MKTNSNIIVGAFLVVLGLLFLLRNFGIFHFSIGDIFRLWPIVLIYIGVDMLPVEEKLKTNLQIAVVILFFVALITLPYISDKHKQNAKFHTEFPFDER